MSQFALLRQRRFAPFFLTQALAAFNDNAFRYAMVGMATFDLALKQQALNTYVNVALGLFILPFFLFSATAGQLAEKFEKARLIQLIKLVEITAMVVATFAFHAHNLTLLLVVLALMGVHSTLFGPIKYAIMPQVLDHAELTGGNGLVEGSTSLAILLGSLVGNTLMSVPDIGPTLTSALVVAIALAGFTASLFIPTAPAPAPELHLRFNLVRETWRVLGHVRHNHTVFNAVLGISWFWFFGATLTTQAPAYARDWLGGDASVLNLILILFSVGVGIGSLFCEKFSTHGVNPTLVPLGALGVTLAGIGLYLVHPHAAAVTDMNWLEFVRTPAGWQASLALGLVGAFAGLYIVPLFAMVQQRTEPRRMARVIAGNNILNALFMVLAAALGLFAPDLGLNVATLILLVTIGNALFMGWLCLRVPEFRHLRRVAG